jgi:TonB family protein
MEAKRLPNSRGRHFLVRLTLLSVLFLAAVGSADERSTGWWEVQRPHVTLRTDLRPEEARRAALAVERTRAALLAAAWPGAKLWQREHIEVVVFSNQQDFQRYFGDRVESVFVHHTDPPVAFLHGPPENWDQQTTPPLAETTSTLKRELTHYLAGFVYKRQPRWFAEGMAEFFETLRLSEDGRTATLGDVNLQALRFYNQDRTTTVAAAFNWGGGVRRTGTSSFGEGMTRPILLSGPGGTRVPQYTYEARVAESEGLSIVKCTITVQGTVTDCEVLKSVRYMDKAVLEWLAGAKYSPVTFQGHPQAVKYVFNFRFKLEPARTDQVKPGPKPQGTTSGLYGVSWLLVHWLYNNHAPEFDRYQTLLANGIDPTEAWKTAFPNLSSATLNSELDHYSRLGEYRNVSVPVPAVEGAVRERPLTSAEVHATRAQTAFAAGGMQAHGEAQFADARAELAAAIAEDPVNLRALQMKSGTVQPAERVALGRSATGAHPGDGLAWLLLAEALPDTPETWDERAQAYRKATELVPDNGLAFNNLAWMLLQKGQPQEALPLAVTAVGLAPWKSTFLDTLAGALAGVGRCDEAITMQARAVDNLPERSSPTERARYAEQLASFQKGCSDGGAPAPAVNPAPANKP